jgi:hypothetical protein
VGALAEVPRGEFGVGPDRMRQTISFEGAGTRDRSYRSSPPGGTR